MAKVFDPFGKQFAVSCTDVSRMMFLGAFHFRVATPTCLFFNLWYPKTLLCADFYSIKRIGDTTIVTNINPSLNTTTNSPELMHTHVCVY